MISKKVSKDKLNEKQDVIERTQGLSVQGKYQQTQIEIQLTKTGANDHKN